MRLSNHCSAIVGGSGVTSISNFVFLGSNIDAVEVGADLGFQRDKSMTYVSTSVGVTAAFDSVADYQHRKRSAGVDARSVSAFTPEERRRARRD